MLGLTGLGQILILIVTNSNNQLVSQIRHRTARNLGKTQNNRKKWRDCHTQPMTWQQLKNDRKQIYTEPQSRIHFIVAGGGHTRQNLSSMVLSFLHLHLLALSCTPSAQAPLHREQVQVLNFRFDITK